MQRLDQSLVLVLSTIISLFEALIQLLCRLRDTTLHQVK
jgi:hypothetical protein